MGVITSVFFVFFVFFAWHGVETGIFELENESEEGLEKKPRETISGSLRRLKLLLVALR